MLRLKRMNPHGRSARINSRSPSLSSSPDTPIMNARHVMRPITPHAPQGSRKRPLISWDEALAACGCIATAELLRLFCGSKRPDQGAILGTLFGLGSPDLHL